VDHDKAALLKLIGHGLPLTAVETGRAPGWDVLGLDPPIEHHLDVLDHCQALLKVLVQVVSVPGDHKDDPRRAPAGRNIFHLSAVTVHFQTRLYPRDGTGQSALASSPGSLPERSDRLGEPVHLLGTIGKALTSRPASAANFRTIGTASRAYAGPHRSSSRPLLVDQRPPPSPGEVLSGEATPSPDAPRAPFTELTVRALP
jgi:hypothetical protein